MTPKCPCGARLWTKADLEAEGGEMDMYLASHMRDDDGYCDEEDDMVPLGYAAEIWRRREAGNPDPVDLNYPL